METKKWEAMLSAVELGSFTRAAQKLGMTQSGLTHMMNALEKDTGLSLLVRDRSGVRLTAAGERLAPAVRELIQAAAHLEEQIAVQSNQRRDSIRVAAYSSVCMHWLPTIVQQFRWAYPGVSVDVRMGSVQEIYRWLQEGTVDLSFASRQEQWRCDWTPLWDDPLLAILPPDYPVREREQFPVSEFDGKEFLMPSLGFDLDILSVFEERNVRPDIRANTAVEDAAILSMVEHGLGVSILSQLVLQGRSDNVQALPLNPPAWRRMGIAARSLAADPMIGEFIAYSKRIVAALHQNDRP